MQISILVISLEDNICYNGVLYDIEGNFVKSHHMVLSARAETEAACCTTEV